MNLTVKQAAERLNISVHTLNRMRSEGGGPEYLKIGAKVLYREADLIAWEQAHLVKNTAAGRKP